MEAEKLDAKNDEYAENAPTGDGFNRGDALMDSAEDVNTSEPSGHVNNVNRVQSIFQGDVVRTRSGSIGIVVGWDTDYDGKEEGSHNGNEESEENVDENETCDNIENSPSEADQDGLPLWLDEVVSTENVNDLTLIDRGFLLNHCVAAASDPAGQVGTVTGVSVSVDLLSPDGLKIENVSTKQIKRVRHLARGDFVLVGHWLGKIEGAIDEVTVSFDDGSACKVMPAFPLDLRPITKNLIDDGYFPYYPGQRVRASSSSIFEDSTWVSGTWKDNRLEGTVTRVSIGRLFIALIVFDNNWPDRAVIYWPNYSADEELSPNKVKFLSSFAHANWKLGDWCLFPSLAAASSTSLDKDLSALGIRDPEDNIQYMAQIGVSYDSEDILQESQCIEDSLFVDAKATLIEDKEKKESNTSNECTRPHSVPKEPLNLVKIRKMVVRRNKKPRKEEEDFERALLITSIKTRVDVTWQDGSVQSGVDSTSLIYSQAHEYDFLPERFVIEKASGDIADAFEVRRVGLIRSLNAKERTACLKWLKPVYTTYDHLEYQEDEIASLYELQVLPHDFYCGDVVIRFTPASTCADTASHKNESQGTAQKNPLGCKKERQTGDEADLDSPDRSWVGIVTGARNGDIEVAWADGTISMIDRRGIHNVCRNYYGTTAGSDGAIDINTEESEFQNASAGKSEPEDSEKTGSERSADSNYENQLQSLQETESMENTCPSEESSLQESNIDTWDVQNWKNEMLLIGKAPSVLDMPEALCDTESLTLDAQTSMEHYRYSFKRFDIVRDPVDHHFFGTAGKTNGRKWLKKVQQDWSLLQNDLPDGIFVRAYEDRMDLLRAVIVGASGTPYHDGLFFFDFHLPPEYPDIPPLAHYHSGGWRINPNLYETGNVCLSLLNTWISQEIEEWDCSSSSILQVLVSLQALVLNSKPYFNEPGYDMEIGTAEGEKHSLSYNENTFLLNCKMMMHLIRTPPQDFNEFVKEYFRERGYYILKACEAYMKGNIVGLLAKDASLYNESSVHHTSAGFKLVLAKILPRLYSAFHELGADCHDFRHFLEL